MQPNQNSTSSEAVEPLGADADSGAFQPGESFNESSTPPGESGELPSWLQNFAGEASGSGSSDSSRSQTESHSDRPEAARQSPSTDDHAGPESGRNNAGFFSEDDLPEWLRALSGDGASTAQVGQAVERPAASLTPNGSVAVPPVTKAWVTTADQPDVSSGANLLSSLVHVIDSRPDAVDVTAFGAAHQPAGESKTSGKARPTAQATPAPSTDASGATSSNDVGSWNRTRKLAIAAIAIALLLLIVLLVGN